jgi:branched-chain amino acid transport system substrate-binding protein
MRRDLGLKALFALAALAALALLAGCFGGGDGPRPLRIGVITDCVGIYRSLEDAELAGAALPLIERGARAAGPHAADGLRDAVVAGRPVELLHGCGEALEFSALTTEVRRLVEREHADVVVAAGTGSDEVVLRELAARHPGTLFLPVVHGPREVTLQRSTPNLFRVAADHDQGVAGLGRYAREQLGWDRAAIVLLNWDAGWGARDAFMAEFCGAGGRVASQLALDFFEPRGADVARVPRDVDGVAVFATSLATPAAFLRRLARREGNVGRRIVVGPGVADDPTLLADTGAALAGAGASSNADPARLRAYLRAFARAYPSVPGRVAAGEQVSGFRDAVEAVASALEAAGGDPAKLAGALARGRPTLLGGPIRLDANRQAVTTTRIVRIGAAGAAPSVLARSAGVDQSLGGLLDPAAVPSSRPAPCRR